MESRRLAWLETPRENGESNPGTVSRGSIVGTFLAAGPVKSAKCLLEARLAACGLLGLLGRQE